MVCIVLGDCILSLSLSGGGGQVIPDYLLELFK